MTGAVTVSVGIVMGVAETLRVALSVACDLVAAVMVAGVFRAKVVLVIIATGDTPRSCACFASAAFIFWIFIKKISPF